MEDIEVHRLLAEYGYCGLGRCKECYLDVDSSGLPTFTGSTLKANVPIGDQRVNPFEGMSSQEINFITHPHWTRLVEEIEKDPSLVYSITQEGKPIAVIISPIAHERVLAEIQDLSDRLKVVEP